VETAAALVGESARLGQRTGLFSTGLVDGLMPCVRPGPRRELSCYLLELVARIAPVDRSIGVAPALASRGLVLPAGTRISVVCPPRLDFTGLQVALPGAAGWEVYQVGAAPEELRPPLPPRVHLVVVGARGEEMTRA